MGYNFGEEKIDTAVWARIEIADNGCWHWTGPLSSHKYARMHINGERIYGHRYMYAQMIGAIPSGLVVDHVCHNVDLTCPGESGCMHRRCVNPAHLEAITTAENVRRSTLTEVSRNAAKTHCMRGHEFTPENTHVSKSGTRSCRICLAARAAEKRDADREAYLKYQRDYYAKNAEVQRAKKRVQDAANRDEKNRKARERYRLVKQSSRPVNA